MTVFCSIVLSVLLIRNVEFYMWQYWLSLLEKAGLSAYISLDSLKIENIELYQNLIKTKKKFIYVRIIIWLIVMRETIVCSMEFLYMIDMCDNFFFHLLNYLSRSFLECFIDLIELLSLCWVYRAQQRSSSLQYETVNEDEKSLNTLCETDISEPEKRKTTRKKVKREAKDNKVSVGLSKDYRSKKESEEQEEFDESYMIKSKFIRNSKKKLLKTGI